MGFAVQLMIIAASMLVGCTNNIRVVSAWNVGDSVSGRVLCQVCTQDCDQWADGGKPIKGAKVSLTCMDKRSRVVYYTNDTTDEFGQYDMTVNKYGHDKELDTEGCYVRLVSSPDNVCNILTDFGGGKSGTKLNYAIAVSASTVYPYLIEYTLNPFYYTTPTCANDDIGTPNYECNGPQQQGACYSCPPKQTGGFFLASISNITYQFINYFKKAQLEI